MPELTGFPSSTRRREMPDNPDIAWSGTVELVWVTDDYPPDTHILRIGKFIVGSCVRSGTASWIMASQNKLLYLPTLEKAKAALLKIAIEEISG